ncbi:pinin [Drosophila bipectinata]|uniref:pinin n=1 Tax=Drosophila bipectinata TaxID=42026 RepID=UPI001C89A121|nr:translation initiation factor IF-2 [Drosophila bipectinata]
MPADPEPTDSQCSKCGKSSAPDQPNPTKESAEDGDQTTTEEAAVAAASVCQCKEEDASTEVVLMDIDNDLTTNEQMPSLAELEQVKPKPKSKKELKEEPEEKEEPEVKEEKEEETEDKKPEVEEEQLKPPATTPPVNVEEEEKPSTESSSKVKQEDLTPSSPEAPPIPVQRTGKITRSSLNGTANQSTRTPTIMKRLRKSTRFKAKQTGTRGNASGNAGQANGHNNGPNGSSGSSAHHLSGAGNHPSNSNKHGKSGTGGPGAGSGARNRRTLFKRPAQKTPKVQACTKFVKSVFYKGSYMQIGDIVSIVDGEQNLYYAQIRGLLVDAYCEKSAFLTWLIPTQDSPDPQEGFDPATYLIGPDEELSRKLCYLEFVMHAPSNYYYDRSTPFPLPDVDEYTAQRSGGYIWTRLPVVKREKEKERSGHKTGGGAS